MAPKQKRETLDYVAGMLSQLERMAITEDQSMLAHLIDMAKLQAREEKRQLKRAARKPCTPGANGASSPA